MKADTRLASHEQARSRITQSPKVELANLEEVLKSKVPAIKLFKRDKGPDEESMIIKEVGLVISEHWNPSESNEKNLKALEGFFKELNNALIKAESEDASPEKLKALVHIVYDRVSFREKKDIITVSENEVLEAAEQITEMHARVVKKIDAVIPIRALYDVIKVMEEIRERDLYKNRTTQEVEDLTVIAEKIGKDVKREMNAIGYELRIDNVREFLAHGNPGWKTRKKLEDAVELAKQDGWVLGECKKFLGK